MSEDGMLIHIRPRLLSKFRNVELVRLTVFPFQLHLSGGIDLMTARPYPNKLFSVGCRKKGQKAIDGILVKTIQEERNFGYRATWAVGSRTFIHEVEFEIEDAEFNAASDCMLLWHGCEGEFGNWKSRKPAWCKDVAPVFAEPVMEVLPAKSSRLRTEDVIDEETGFITERKQKFTMPSLERERILQTKLHQRMPRLEDAFVEEIPDYYDIKIYRDGVEVNPKPPEPGRCMLCGNPTSGWCACSKRSEFRLKLGVQ